MKRNLFAKTKIFVVTAMLVVLVLGCFSGCNTLGNKVKFDPSNPVTITVWHYYNGAILNAFDNLVNEFNNTIGMEKGIIVEGYNYGNVGDLEQAVLSSAKKEVGSKETPNIFASYADTAYEAEKLGILANLSDYLTVKEQGEYIDSYIEEGKIGLNGELRIFPIAKSTEIFMLNDTDWQPFAQENNLTYDDISTIEGLVNVSKLYYEWTDAKTPNVPNDGNAFFGRDSIANMIIIAAKELGTEIFEVTDGNCTLNVTDKLTEKLWENYYLPYISGYFNSYGKFRSDDTKVGEILGYVGSTASASYFPSEVTANGSTYPVEAKILPAPHFEEGEKVMVQQGAGMVVTKSTALQEAASVEFLKFFTDINNNSVFSAMSGYMPVKKEAANYETLMSKITDKNQIIGEIADATLKIALDQIKVSELYTNKAFTGGTTARNILDTSLQDWAVKDREGVVKELEAGTSFDEAVAKFNTTENYEAWVTSFKSGLEAAINK